MQFMNSPQPSSYYNHFFFSLFTFAYFCIKTSAIQFVLSFSVWAFPGFHSNSPKPTENIIHHSSDLSRKKFFLQPKPLWPFFLWNSPQNGRNQRVCRCKIPVNDRTSVRERKAGSQTETVNPLLPTLNPLSSAHHCIIHTSQHIYTLHII